MPIQGQKSALLTDYKQYTAVLNKSIFWKEVPFPSWRSMLFQGGGGTFSKLEEQPFPKWRRYLFQIGGATFSNKEKRLRPSTEAK